MLLLHFCIIENWGQTRSELNFGSFERLKDYQAQEHTQFPGQEVGSHKEKKCALPKEVKADGSGFLTRLDMDSGNQESIQVLDTKKHG